MGTSPNVPASWQAPGRCLTWQEVEMWHEVGIK